MGGTVVSNGSGTVNRFSRPSSSKSHRDEVGIESGFDEVGEETPRARNGGVAAPDPIPTETRAMR